MTICDQLSAIGKICKTSLKFVPMVVKAFELLLKKGIKWKYLVMLVLKVERFRKKYNVVYAANFSWTLMRRILRDLSEVPA